jgi:hypothetical protein
MNVLKFKKGCKNWETTYEAELDFEYTHEQRKRISSLIIHRPDTGRKVAIPWQIFESYANHSNAGVFADQTGLKLGLANDGLEVSCGQSFNVVIHEDQIAAIMRAARNVTEDVSYSVESILMEYSSVLSE